MWIKYRQNFESHIGHVHGPWEYQYFLHDLTASDIDKFGVELRTRYNWSIEYRGCDIETVAFIDVPYMEMRETIKHGEGIQKQLDAIRTAMFHQLIAQQIANFNRD